MKKNNIKIITWSLAGANILLAFAYVIFLNTAIWNVVGRQQTEKSIKKITSEVSALESVYVSLNSKISPEHALSLGFKNTSSGDTIFVNRSIALGMR